MKSFMTYKIGCFMMSQQQLKSRSSSSSVSLLKVIYFFVILMIGLTCCESAPKRNHLEKYKALPDCSDDYSVCGYLQVNSMGIHGQSICRCKNGNSCPMVWDPFDGRTVLHGNDQYKYCDRAPKLNICSRDEIVYTTYMEMSMISMETLINTNHIHCLCPGTQLFIRNNTKFHDLEDGNTVIGTSYQCKPPPRCGSSDACMGITESVHSSFITRKCSCPMGMFCPIDVRLASERVELDRGAYYIMKCM